METKTVFNNFLCGGLTHGSLFSGIGGFEQVLCDLSKIGYDAEWQCISNLAFGYPHRRERIYVIAYSNQIRPQSDICESGGFNSIFRKWASNPGNGYSCAKRILEIGAHSDIRNDDGFRDWTHRVGSVGNAVNPTIAYYLFECIKAWEKKLLKTETKAGFETVNGACQ